MGIDPVFAYLGPLTVRWYGLLLALALAVGIAVAVREGRRRRVPEDDVYSLAIWAVLAGVAAARLFPVLEDWETYRHNLRAAIAFQQGGLAMFGALAGGILAGLVYCRLRGLPVGRLADTAAPALVLAQAVGRIGCLINGDTWGSPTSLPWGIAYTNPGAMIPSQLLGIPTHPIPAYEILWGLALFALLWHLRSRPLREGTLFLVYIVLHGTGRLFLTLLRQHEMASIAGLHQTQVFSVLAIAGGLLILWRMSGTASGEASPAARPASHQP